MGILKRISRYPVKGLSPEDLPEVDLVAMRGLPHDRQFALALPETQFDELNPQPLPKTKFVVLARFARLAALCTKLDIPTSVLSLSHAGSIVGTGSLGTREGREAVERAIGKFMGDELDGRPHIVKGNNHRFTDVSVHSPVLMEAVSVINLATVRALEERLQRPVDPRRFRANLLIDGIEPWKEFELIDRAFKIGKVTVRGVRRTKRCPATEVNPDTAERDIQLPVRLLEQFGHGDLGIYLTIMSDGVLRVDDPVLLPGVVT